jgi:NTP pyrophosphatase (non-canonical NTP hydrolase)
MLTFDQFSEVNKDRTENGFHHLIWDWLPVQWSNAAAGEMGETCNSVKKMDRYNLHVGKGEFIPEETIAAERDNLEKEIGDVVVYLDLLAQRMGFTLEGCVRKAFNEVSEREGFPHRLP